MLPALPARLPHLARPHLAWPHLALAVAVSLGLAACTGPVIMGTDAAIIYATKPSDPPPANTKDQIPPHRTWCYKTLAAVECFAHAQDVPPGRLINVDPANEYPLDVHAYRDAVAAGH